MPRLTSPELDARLGSSGALAVLSGCRDVRARKIAHVVLVAATSLWLAAAAAPSAHADVVFGNLGVSGTQAITSPFASQQTFPTTTNATNPRALAMGFKTSNDFIPWLYNSNLKSVTLGMANIAQSGTVARSVTIQTDAGGKPSGTVLATSNTINISGTTPALYTFTFATMEGQVVLARNTSYWVVPSETQTPGFRWFQDNEREAPTAFNGSGFSSLGTMAKNTSNQWVSNLSGNTASIRPYSLSISVIPVPESSTLTLAGIGLGIGGWAARRRSRRDARQEGLRELEEVEHPGSECDDQA